jgi:hypothetical protein
MPPHDERPFFSLDEARALLPRVKHVTADAVRRVERLAAELHGMSPGSSSGVDADQPEHEALSTAMQEVVKGWAEELQTMGVEPKGLWLVDFDNGEGYYCWCYPEDGITHYHGYTDGFAGRMTIQ